MNEGRRFLTSVPVQLALALVAMLGLASCSAPITQSSSVPTASPSQTPAEVVFTAPTTPLQPAQPATPVCLQAAGLNQEGYPQRALQLLKDFDAQAAQDMAGTECVDQRGEAFARIGAAERLAQAAGLMKPAPSAAPGPEASRSAGQKCQSVPPVPGTINGTDILSVALSCDRENAKAQELNAAASSRSTDSQLLQKKWATLAERQIAPIQDIALAVTLWLAISLVILWFAPFLLRNKGLPEQKDPGGGRPLGIALVLIGALVGTFLAAETEDFVVIVGAALTLIGLAVWDNFRRSQLKLVVTVAGEDGEKSAADLRGIMGDMGSSLPRGVEVPIGPDVTAIKDVDFTVFGAGSVVNALKALLMLVRPYAPWELSINSVNDGRLAVTLRRNNVQLASEIIDRASLHLDADSLAKLDVGSTTGKTAGTKDGSKKDDDKSVSMWPFAAALTLTQMAAAHQLDGLGGATNWRSIALHHIATTQFRRSPFESGLLARAVDLDPGNTPAAIAFWNAIYRTSGEASDLKEYAALLKGVPKRLGGPNINLADAKEAGLLLRAKYSLAAVLVNLGYLGEGTYTEVHGTWKNLSDEIDAILGKPGHPAHELAVTMRPLVNLMEVSVINLAGLNAPFVRGDVIDGGPLLHYAAACALVSWVPGFGGLLSASKAHLAVGRLRIADLSPALRALRSSDPQLAALRKSKGYRMAYGAKVEDDLLTIEPFIAHATLLRSLGLNSAKSIGSTSPGYFVSLGIPRAVAAGMTRTSHLAMAVTGKGLDDWEVPITEFLAQRNLWTLGPQIRPVSGALKTALGKLASWPSGSQLSALWN